MRIANSSMAMDTMMFVASSVYPICFTPPVIPSVREPRNAPIPSAVNSWLSAVASTSITSFANGAKRYMNDPSSSALTAVNMRFPATIGFDLTIFAISPISCHMGM